MLAGKKALYLAAAGVLGLFCLMACGSFRKGGGAEAPEEINLRESGGQEEVKKALSAAGIPDADSREFFREVERFNTAVGNASTEDEMADRWEKAYPDFIGTNCRVTAFMLARSLVKVEGGEAASEASEDNLSFDLEAIKSAPEALWDSGENDAFTRLFAEVAAADSTDTAVQCEQVQKAWRERGLSFSGGKASIVTVWLHSKLEPEDNILFPGHVGVLLQEESGKLLFIEKLAFQKQYRALRFKDRAGLNAYLMGLYDIDENQPTARCFLMENDKMMQDYRVLKKESMRKAESTVFCRH